MFFVILSFYYNFLCYISQTSHLSVSLTTPVQKPSALDATFDIYFQPSAPSSSVLYPPIHLTTLGRQELDG